MEFVAGVPFEEAIQKLGERSPVTSVLNSYDWRRVPTDLRERAFFSSTIENARFLDRAQQFLENFLSGARETNEAGETYLKAGGRAQFIEELQKFAIREGMGPLSPDDRGTLKDITSESRLGLIFDTNLKAAQDYGYWKQGQDADVLDAFPSQRFIRVVAVRKPRPLHEKNRGEVKRKDDLDFWLAMNDPAIGGLGVPWGPWGFNSGMGVEDVGRKESDALGVTSSEETIKPVQGELNDRLQASTQNLDPRLVNFLKAAFGDQVDFDGDSVKWNTPSRADSGELRPEDRPVGDTGDVTRRIGQAAGSVFEEVFAGWHAPFNRAAAEASEAQIAAASLGTKPLYFDLWGEQSSRLAAGLRPHLPPGTEVRSNAAGLFVFRPETLRPIIESDPAFYGSADDVWAAIQRVSPEQNGELLGYGARSFDPAAPRVFIFDPGDPARIYDSFSTSPDAIIAQSQARARANEIALYIGREVAYRIEPTRSSSRRKE